MISIEDIWELGLSKLDNLDALSLEAWFLGFSDGYLGEYDKVWAENPTYQKGLRDGKNLAIETQALDRRANNA